MVVVDALESPDQGPELGYLAKVRFCAFALPLNFTTHTARPAALSFLRCLHTTAIHPTAQCHTSMPLAHTPVLDDAKRGAMIPIGEDAPRQSFTDLKDTSASTRHAIHAGKKVAERRLRRQQSNMSQMSQRSATSQRSSEPFSFKSDGTNRSRFLSGVVSPVAQAVVQVSANVASAVVSTLSAVAMATGFAQRLKNRQMDKLR